MAKKVALGVLLFLTLTFPVTCSMAMNQPADLNSTNRLELQTNQLNKETKPKSNVIYVGAPGSETKKLLGKIMLVIGTSFLFIAAYAYGSKKKD